MKTNLHAGPQRGLSFGQALIICSVIFTLYKIFRSAELDKEFEKIEKKNSR